MAGLRRLDGEVCAASFGILTWFLLHSWRGLFVYFSNDDIMNLYWARETPLWKLAFSALVPFTTVYRPTGAVLYRCLYALFGLNPLPFRIVFYGLLLISLILLYKLIGLIAVQRSAGVLAALIASFHGRFSDLYMNNGTIYDVLCGCFYLGTLCYYVSIRSRGLRLDRRRMIVLYFLATAALNSKEMAATLPIVFLFYELLLPSRQFVPLGMIGLVVAIGTWARFRDTSRLMHNDLYALHPNLGLPNIAGYLNDLFYLRAGCVTELTAIAILVALFGIAALARSRVLLLWALFIVVAPLPVMFIPHRSLYAFYIPVMAWAAFAGTLLSRIPLPAAVVLVAVVLLVKHVPIPWSEAMPYNSKLYTLHRDLMANAPKLTAGSRVLFLHDAFTGDAWTPLMFVRLTYNDLDLQLLRRQERCAAAAAVFDYVDGRMVRLK